MTTRDDHKSRSGNQPAKVSRLVWQFGKIAWCDVWIDTCKRPTLSCVPPRKCLAVTGKMTVMSAQGGRAQCRHPLRLLCILCGKPVYVRSKALRKARALHGTEN